MGDFEADSAREVRNFSTRSAFKPCHVQWRGFLFSDDGLLGIFQIVLNGARPRRVKGLRHQMGVQCAQSFTNQRNHPGREDQTGQNSERIQLEEVGEGIGR